MEIRRVLCDSCANDLTITSNSVGWRLALINQNIPSCPGPVNNVMVYPKIERDCHFCALECLTKWLQKYRNSPFYETDVDEKKFKINPL